MNTPLAAGNIWNEILSTGICKYFNLNFIMMLYQTFKRFNAWTIGVIFLLVLCDFIYSVVYIMYWRNRDNFSFFTVATVGTG